MVSPRMKSDTQWPTLEAGDSMVQARFGDALPSSSSSAPAQPMDGLQSTAPPPFLTKTYDMVDDPATDAVVSWSKGNNSFVVWNPPEFAQDLLPKYFKHNNFSSFVRQLNTYGFRKVDPDRWEFANEGFLRGRRELLRGIHRRKPSSHGQQQQQQGGQGSLGPCVEVGKFGLEGEIERLKRDKNVLMLELVRLRQQQQNTERDLQVMGQRLQVTEQRQQQMMSFLAKAMQSPSFLAQLVQQQNDSNMRLAPTVRKKRRLPKQDGSEGDSLNPDSPPDGQIVTFQPNGSAETGARAMLMQFFNPSDTSAPALDSGPLEALLRDLSPAPVGPDVNSLNRQSGVTLTEMHISTGLPDNPSGDPVVTDLPDEPILHLPHSPVHIPRIGGAQSLDSGVKYSPSRGSRDTNGDSMELAEEGGRLSPETEEVSSNVDSPAVGSGANDVFWEQFLSETPNSPAASDTEVETESLAETGADVGESSGGALEICTSDHKGDETRPNNWWNSKRVDQLADQMGQLAPG